MLHPEETWEHQFHFGSGCDAAYGSVLANQFIFADSRNLEKGNLGVFQCQVDETKLFFHEKDICCEGYFKLSQDEYLEIKKFIDNNIDIIESTLAPMNDCFD